MMKLRRNVGLLALTPVLLIGATAREAMATKVGQPVNWTVSAPLTTTNPSAANDATAADIVTQIGQGLYRYDKAGKPVLADAKSVVTSADGRTVTFKLKAGLRWSNGAKLTAADYVYGFQQTVNPRNASNSAAIAKNIHGANALVTGASQDFASLGVKALNEDTLQLQLDHPMPALPSILTSTAFFPQNKAFEDKVGAKYGTSAANSISNGPFVLQQWNGSNTTYALTKNDHYVDQKQVRTQKITIRTITDTTTGYNLYQAGDVDYAVLGADQVRASQHKADFQVVKTGRTDFIGLNQQNKLLQNRALRKALQLSINRTELSKRVLTGSERQGQTFTPDGVARNPKTARDFAKDASLSQNTFSAKQAQKFFRTAQKELAGQQLKLTLLSDDDDQSKKEAQYIQSQLTTQLPALKVTIKSEPKAARVKAQLSQNYDMVLTSWGGDYGDPMSFLNLFTTTSGLNIVKYQNAAYDKLLATADNQHADQPEQRYTDLKKADGYLQRDAPVIVLGYKSLPTLQRTTVSGVIQNPVGTLDLKSVYKK